LRDILPHFIFGNTFIKFNIIVYISMIV